MVRIYFSLCVRRKIMPRYRQPFSDGKYTTKPPVCQGFCVIFASPGKQAFVKHFNNLNYRLLNFKEEFSQKMEYAIRHHAPLRPEVPSFQFVNESLTKKANKPLGVSSYKLEQVVERMVRELEQRKGETGGC